MMPVAMRWMIGGEWRTVPVRTLVTALVVAIGVALGFAVHLINASALTEFGRAVRTVNGDADLQVHAVSPLGFDEALYPRLARMDGVGDASPVVELRARTGGGRSFTLLGLDLFRAAQVTPMLVPPAAANTGSDAAGANALFLSEAALQQTGLKLGERTAVTAGGQTAEFTVQGRLPAAAEDEAIGVIDIAEAQWRFAQLGRIHRVDVKLAEEANADEVREAIAALLPRDAELVTDESQSRRSDGLSRAYRVNLDMLALMALLSGGFLIYSAQSLSVARRRAQFALLRVLGTPQRALLLQVLAEGAAIGIGGALAGLALGLLLAEAGLNLFGGDLGGGYFGARRPDLIFAPGAAIAFFVLGVTAALAGSFLPARDAARAQPAVALKDLGDAVDPKARPQLRLPMALLSVGVLAALLPPIGELPLFGYLSIALLLAGGITAMPLLARVLLAPLQRRAAPTPALDLAVKRLWGAPSQAAIALCGIVASASLVVAMAVMITSFRGSVDEWLTQVLHADVYLHVEGGEAAGLDTATQQELLRLPGVASIEFTKVMPLRLSPDRPAVALIPWNIDAANPRARLAITSQARDIPAGVTPVWVSEAMTSLYGYRTGERVALPVVGDERFFVAGTWRDYARQHGAVAMRNADYTRLTRDSFRTEAAVALAPGAEAGRVSAAIRAALPPGLRARAEFARPAEIRVEALRVFDRSFAITYLLEAIAILVGLAGVAASFSAQTLARTKEFGMLRHVGVLKRQVMAMLAGEGALLGLVGVVAGIALGLAISQVLIHVVNPQSFHWTMETRLPLSLFAVVAVALIVSAAGTALLAGRRALSGSTLRAVSEDW